MTTSAIAELTAGFEEPFWALGHDAARDRDAVVISWPSVPVEIVRAAGLRAVAARGSAAPTPEADAVLEPDLFPNRLRQLVEAALTGRLEHVAAIVLPRTSDPDYKCFLYLRELVRRGAAALPPVLLFDLLHSTGAEVYAYDTARVRDLFERLIAIAGRRPAPDDVRAAVDAANAAREAARRLDSMRRPEPRIAGADALPLLGVIWQIAPRRYAALASAAADAIAARPVLAGPRVLVAGAPVDSTALHAALEAAGAIVVAEASPFGAAGRDVDVAADPFAAIAARYRTSAVDARTPVTATLRFVEAMLPSVDAVAISLPPDDASFAWDYPRLRSLLERRGLPYVVLEHDPAEELPPADRGRVEALLDGREARYG